MPASGRLGRERGVHRGMQDARCASSTNVGRKGVLDPAASGEGVRN
jgi:hypothetical protein